MIRPQAIAQAFIAAQPSLDDLSLIFLFTHKSTAVKLIHLFKYHQSSLTQLGASSKIINFLRLIDKYRFYTKLVSIVNQVIKLAQQHNIVTFVQITTGRNSRIPLKLLTRVQNQISTPIIATITTDPQLLGGVKINLPTQVLDLSIQTRLKILKQTLIKD